MQEIAKDIMEQQTPKQVYVVRWQAVRAAGELPPPGGHPAEAVTGTDEPAGRPAQAHMRQACCFLRAPLAGKSNSPLILRLPGVMELTTCMDRG